VILNKGEDYTCMKKQPNGIWKVMLHFFLLLVLP
jgi:hypothetical protein